MESLPLVFPVVMCKPPISLWSPNSRLKCFPLCSGRESVVCQCFPVYYPACQKNSGRDMRWIHSGELHPILFFSPLFFLSERCFVSVKRAMFLNTISMCWHPNCEVLKLAKNIVSARCCGASELQKYNMKGVILCMLVYLLTTSPCCYSSLTSP